jgi:hypothetical protein
MKGQLERGDIVEVHFFEKTGDIIQMNTVDGEAVDGCVWSPVLCQKCGWRPCDDSC